MIGGRSNDSLGSDIAVSHAGESTAAGICRVWAGMLLIGVTREITNTYDALSRLTAAAYSTGETYAYHYDSAGNREVLTVTHNAQPTTTHYTYDSANRLTRIQLPDSSIQAYTWDNRGNLLADGTFTYTYNAAGRMVQAQNLTATLVYTYNADGLRVAQSQSVSSVESVDTFTWDWATPVPELLSDGESLYLVGYDTLGWQRGADWTFVLPDALGSVRQETDAAGAVTAVREWSPYGEEVGGAQAGLGFTGEWYDANVGLTYLRARWYDGMTGRFTTRDPIAGLLIQPQTQNPYPYALNTPLVLTDPSGEFSELPWWLVLLLMLTSCTSDRDCDISEAQAVLAQSQEPDCTIDKSLGLGSCSKQMTAAFWLDYGDRATFKRECAVIQWMKGQVTIDKNPVTCIGRDCTRAFCMKDQPCPMPPGTLYCPLGGMCINAPVMDTWMIDTWAFWTPPEVKLDDYPDRKYPSLEGVDEGRALYTTDTPTILVNPGAELSVSIEWVTAVYSRREISSWLETAVAGKRGNPWSVGVDGIAPKVALEWDFQVESYIPCID
jgi:RHS repeat-associated protein